MKDIKTLISLAAFAAVVNIINIFSNDIALLLILLSFAALIFEISFWCCHGYHSWQEHE